MLIKTEGLATCTNGERTWNEPYEIWFNPKLVVSVLPEIKGIKLLGDDDYTRLTDGGFERFCKVYEQVDGL